LPIIFNAHNHYENLELKLHFAIVIIVVAKLNWPWQELHLQSICKDKMQCSTRCDLGCCTSSSQPLADLHKMQAPCRLSKWGKDLDQLGCLGKDTAKTLQIMDMQAALATAIIL
jgi:hypothetical protein